MTALWPFAAACASGDIFLLSLLIINGWLYSRRRATRSAWPDMQAYIRGVLPQISALSDCTLFCRRILAAEVWPPAAAHESGVRPDMSWASTSAPCSNRASIPNIEPTPAAKERGVRLLTSARSTLLGSFSIRVHRRGSSFFSAATERAVLPPLFKLILTSFGDFNVLESLRFADDKRNRFGSDRF